MVLLLQFSFPPEITISLRNIITIASIVTISLRNIIMIASIVTISDLDCDIASKLMVLTSPEIGFGKLKPLF